MATISSSFLFVIVYNFLKTKKYAIKNSFKALKIQILKINILIINNLHL